MSTSLNVVSMAAVFCASFKRRAMVCRNLVMRTRSSRAASSGGDSARATVGADAGAIEGPLAIAASISPLVTRPSLPEPAMAAGSTPELAANLRTAGGCGASPETFFGAGAAAAVFAAAGAADLAASTVAFAGAAFAATLPPPAPSAIEPNSAPIATVSPSLALISDKTPATGAGTSTVTLSVSNSTSGSSAATASPAFLTQRPMVASVTDSPSVGTRISVAIVKSPNGLTQRLVDERFQLLQVARHQSGRGRGRSRTPDITRPRALGLNLFEHPFEIRLHERPGALVARLFLAPDDLRALEAGKLGYQRLQRERIELLDTHEINVADAAFLALFVEVVIDLARAEHDAANLIVGGELDGAVRMQLRVVPQHAMEKSVRPHLVELRNRALVTQQRLRCHHDQWLAEVALQLPA